MAVGRVLVFRPLVARPLFVFGHDHFISRREAFSGRGALPACVLREKLAADRRHAV